MWRVWRGPENHRKGNRDVFPGNIAVGITMEMPLFPVEVRARGEGNLSTFQIQNISRIPQLTKQPSVPKDLKTGGLPR